MKQSITEKKKTVQNDLQNYIFKKFFGRSKDKVQSDIFH